MGSMRDILNEDIRCSYADCLAQFTPHGTTPSPIGQNLLTFKGACGDVVWGKLDLHSPRVPLHRCTFQDLYLRHQHMGKPCLPKRKTGFQIYPGTVETCLLKVEHPVE
jgi:hypothetical protein